MVPRNRQIDNNKAKHNRAHSISYEIRCDDEYFNDDYASEDNAKYKSTHGGRDNIPFTLCNA